MKQRKRIGLLMLPALLLLVAALGATASPGPENPVPVISHFNPTTETTTGVDIPIRAIVDHAVQTRLYYRWAGEARFSWTLMRPSRVSPYSIGFIPAGDRHAPYVEYYIEARGPGNRTAVTSPRRVETVYSVPPSFSDVTITADWYFERNDHKFRAFYDLALSDYILDGHDLSNVSRQLRIPDHSGAEPRITCRVGQIRKLTYSHDRYSNPHKGLDLGMPAGRRVYPVADGIVDETVTHALKVYHSSLGFYSIYTHVDHNKAKGDPVDQDTHIATVQDTAHDHLHLSMQDGNGYDLPQYIFWKDKAWEKGHDLDFISEPTWNGRTVSVKVYALNGDPSDPEEVNDVYLCYLPEDEYVWLQKKMSKSKTSFSYTLSSTLSGKQIACYFWAYRNSLSDTNLKAFRPLYWNAYWDGSRFISTKPSEYFGYLVP